MLALLSVSDKRGLVPFAQGLIGCGYTILSTGGTLEALKAAGVAARKVSAHTGTPEILGGRVKTLHPKIHGGILGRPTLESDAREMAEHGIEAISLVAVNLYPFRETVAKGASRDETIEQIDIGGPAMVRASAKNAAFVTIVVDPDDYGAVLEELQSAKAISEKTRRSLQRKAFAHTAAYDAAIAAWLTEQNRQQPEAARDDAERSGSVGRGAATQRTEQNRQQPEAARDDAERSGSAGRGDATLETAFPDELSLPFVKSQGLRYGENPHQRGAFYREHRAPAEPTVAFSEVLQGKELSYNNILDLDAALGLVLEFSERPAAVVIKHNTPCGVAVDDELEVAYRRARAIDETSAFGGIIALNREVDVKTATALAETFLEAVIAPGYSAAAREVLAGKKNLRLLAAGPGLASPTAKPRAQLDARSVSGGLLVMDRDAVEPASEWKVVSQRQPSAEELEALRFAWKICKHVKSNAIVFAGPRELLAQAGGQTSRVDSVKIAAMRGGARLKGSAVASDAFFPFRDGLDALAAAGAGCVVQPGGSVRDPEVIAAADEHGLCMIFTGVRHFRH